MKKSLQCIRAGLAVALLSGTGGAALAQSQSLTVISFGGATKAAQEVAYFKPFEQSGAAKVVAGEYNGELSRIKAMVDVGQVSWDVVEVESPELLRGCEEGLFEPVNASVLGEAGQYLPGTISECGVASYVWSMVLAYNAKRLDTAPASWADFWNVEKFPGKRGLRKGAKYTLEAALLADGVPREELYKVLATPDGVARAFAKLDEIKPHIQWWEAGAQPPQWLVAGDVVMSAAYNGRVAVAQREGASLAIVWDGNLFDPDHWAIVRGSRNKELAERFIAFASQAEPQQAFSRQIPYGPVNRAALDALPDETRQQLPTAPENLAQAQLVDAGFWVDHGEELEQRFNAWAAR
ncbi:ABC transporter substrate-binding protein [Zestomonas carbonaria]|uniref:Spermidine/putrescine transport system substrate-binding protein n=1 Tax=Zestomonas carbonaria TaxID=2762745 RepID=A0A7U7EKQ1_9GAMM|nr:ABC transporter substrate-binding protein [Pseudomonas carbonaria]CAD5106252.1 hypothetical protein PSEWESI4_00512 [Pseudomonas carbonaria]